jgi:ferrous-iron efflux pump FieF
MNIEEGRSGTAENSRLESKRVQQAATLAACVAVGLALSKLALFLMSGSLVVALSAWDSAADSVVSFANRFVLRYARQDADDDHPYGHGKAETLAAVAQGAAIMSGAILIFIAAAERIWGIVRGQPAQSQSDWFTAIFFLFAAAASGLLTWWLRRQSMRYDSPALFADSEHYRVDVLTNVGSSISLAAILLTGVTWLDSVIACVFAIYVAWGGFVLMKTNIGGLMDKDVPDDLKQQALDVILGVSPHIVDVHNFRGRKSGSATLFDFHLTLPTALPFEQVHGIVERVEDTLRIRFGGDSFIHADPDCVPISEREKPYSRRDSQK